MYTSVTIYVKVFPRSAALGREVHDVFYTPTPGNPLIGPRDNMFYLDLLKLRSRRAIA